MNQGFPVHCPSCLTRVPAKQWLLHPLIGTEWRCSGCRSALGYDRTWRTLKFLPLSLYLFVLLLVWLSTFGGLAQWLFSIPALLVGTMPQWLKLGLLSVTGLSASLPDKAVLVSEEARVDGPSTGLQ